MDAIRTYDYLKLTRHRVFDSIRPLTDEQYRREFPFGLKTIASTITHIMLCEWAYVERVSGRTLAPYEQWPIKDEAPPAFGVIEATWIAQEQRSRDALASETDWTRTVRYTTFPDSRGKRYEITTTPSQIVTQLILHEVHHRAQVMAMLRMTEGATPVEDIDFNDLMYQRREVGP